MLTLIAIVHVIIALLLIVLVLLQDSKGGAMGILGGGGGSNTLFGSTGASNFLVTATKWLAIVFAATCIGLAYLSTKDGSSVLDADLPAAVPNSETIDTSKALEESASGEKTGATKTAPAQNSTLPKEQSPTAPEEPAQ